MSTAISAPASARPVLPGQALAELLQVNSRTKALARDGALVVAGAGLTSLLAQVVIPASPVPITGQTLAVVLAGAALGPARGLLSQLLYLLLIGFGLPVYAQAWSQPSTLHGWDYLTGASGGYILGFLPAALLLGWGARMGLERRVLPALALMSAGQLVVFAIGVPWLAVVKNLDAATALSKGFVQYIPGGIVKSAIATAILTGAWAAVTRRSRAK